MADLGQQSEFSPAEFSAEELDRLEDALERWTSANPEDLSPVPEDSSLAPHLRARLEDYRSLLAMTRDELPMEDVPDALLASVLAEAHASAQPRARPVTRREIVPAGPSLWERLRRSMLLPGFALAGSAALLLWVVQPGSDTSLGDDSLDEDRALLERTAQAPAQLSRPRDASPAPAAAEPPSLEESPLAAPDAGAEAARTDARAPADLPATAPADASHSLDEADLKDLAKTGRAPTKKSAKKSLEPAEPIETYPGLDDTPTAEGVDKEALRDTLDTADAARRKGGCIEAMNLYVEAMKMSGASSERARARAGYGLCLATQGQDDTADRYFDAARALSPAIDGWIKRERGDGPSRKAPAKPSAKAKMESPLD
jgi:tetratricopeptide (TPR) repeat protein